MVYPIPILSLIFIALLALYLLANQNTVAAAKICLKFQCKVPSVNDPRLKIEAIYTGNTSLQSKNNTTYLSPVTKMAFLEDNDILLLDKNIGKVLRIINNTMVSKPLLDLNVANKWERGLLGIAVLKQVSRTYVFLYYTESKIDDGTDVCPTIYCENSVTDPSQARLVRYELRDGVLANPRMLFSLPASNVASHIGGAIEIGPDKNVYVIIGDFHGNYNRTTNTLALNSIKGGLPDGRAGILRFTSDGNVVEKGILGEKSPLDLYYAYGIRNGYGLDFDPVSGRLWDTENGPEFGDEINLVMPGFNSGWASVEGIWEGRNSRELGDIVLNQPEKKLVDFGGKGVYSAPELAWNHTVAPTALRFLDSDKLGSEYENDLFVASSNTGQVYHFELNDDRKALALPSVLADDFINAKKESSYIFASGLGKITDINVGPDGNMYILSSYHKLPTIFKISNRQ